MFAVADLATNESISEDQQLLLSRSVFDIAAVKLKTAKYFRRE